MLLQVPFEHKAPLGFYEVDGEHSIVPQQNLLNVSGTLNPQPATHFPKPYP